MPPGDAPQVVTANDDVAIAEHASFPYVASTRTPPDEIELMGDVKQLSTGQLLSTRGKPLSQRGLIDLGPAVKFSIDRVQDILDQIALFRRR